MIAPKKRGLKHTSNDMTVSDPWGRIDRPEEEGTETDYSDACGTLAREAALIAPKKRGLKPIRAHGGESLSHAALIAPKKRGLKRLSKEREELERQAALIAPKKRGLKPC